MKLMDKANDNDYDNDNIKYNSLTHTHTYTYTHLKKEDNKRINKTHLGYKSKVRYVLNIYKYIII